MPEPDKSNTTEAARPLADSEAVARKPADAEAGGDLDPTRAEADADDQGRDATAGPGQAPEAAPPSDGQKLLNRLLEVRNRIGRAQVGMVDLLKSVRGPKKTDPKPLSDAPAEARQETSFLAGFDALVADLEGASETIEKGMVELKKFF